MSTISRDHIGEKTLALAQRERNACLSALPAEALAELRPYLSESLLNHGTALWGDGARVSDVFFPLSGLISIVLPMADGESIEVASVAREGAAGSFFDPRPEEPATLGIVQIGGRFAHISARHLAEVAAGNASLQKMLDCCRSWLMAQAQQIAACNSLHSADKRLCRWLYQAAEKTGAATLFATQEAIGSLLGIRRTTVTLLAQGLHAQGLIDYRRGKITVLNIKKLEAAACECGGRLGPNDWPAARATHQRVPLAPGGGAMSVS